VLYGTKGTGFYCNKTCVGLIFLYK